MKQQRISLNAPTSLSTPPKEHFSSLNTDKTELTPVLTKYVRTMVVATVIIRYDSVGAYAAPYRSQSGSRRSTKKMKSSTRKFDSVQQEAYLAIWRTYDRLRAIEDALFSEWNLSAQQYNVLRLLESANPQKIPTLSLTARLISRAPDITRMLDRLEENGWVERERSAEDRRTVLVGITGPGLALLKQLRRPLAQCHEKQLGHLSQRELTTLSELLSRAREPHESEDGFWK